MKTPDDINTPIEFLRVHGFDNRVHVGADAETGTKRFTSDLMGSWAESVTRRLVNDVVQTKLENVELQRRMMQKGHNEYMELHILQKNMNHAIAHLRRGIAEAEKRERSAREYLDQVHGDFEAEPEALGYVRTAEELKDALSEVLKILLR